MTTVEAVDHLLHEVLRLHVHPVERHLDLEGLLAVAHVHRPPHVHLAAEGGAEAPPALLLHLREQPPEPRGADLTRLAHVRAHELVAQVGGQHAPRGEHRGHARHHHPADLEHPRHVGDVQAGRAAEGEQGEAAGIGPAAHRDQPDALRHVGVHHPVDALRRRDHVQAEPLRDALHRGTRRLRIEARAPAQEARGVEQAQHQVGVGHRRRGAAPAIAGGPRRGARALRADVQDAARVHPRDRPAAGAQGVDVDAGQGHPARAHRLVAGEVGLSALEQRDVGAGAPHVERDQVALAEQPRGVTAARDTARGTGEDRARREAHRVRDGRHPAVRLHDEHVAPVARGLQARSERPEIPRQHRSHVGVDHGGAESLVLLDLGQHVGGERHVGVGQQARE